MKFISVLIIAIIFLSACGMQNSKDSQQILSGKKQQFFYVGTYTHGVSEGIYKYALNENGMLDSIALVASTQSPSFLTLNHNKEYLIAGNEIKLDNGNGTVESYKIEDDKLHLISRSNSGGAHTCHVQVNPNGVVLAANYSGGNIGVLNIDSLGRLSDLLEVKQHEGKGTTDRQEGPHAHSAWFTPNGKEVIGVDLGTNELWFYKITEAGLQATKQQKLAMADGAGPRHLTFHPNGMFIYVLNELNGTLSTVVKNAEVIYEVVATVKTLPEDFTEYNKCADIHISSDGKFLYATNRGHNSIVIYSVSDQGELNLLAFESTRGEEPRNFKLSPNEEYVVLANQKSDKIVSYKRNSETGLLTFVNEIYAPAPVCILFE